MVLTFNHPNPRITRLIRRNAASVPNYQSAQHDGHVSPIQDTVLSAARTIGQILSCSHGVLGTAGTTAAGEEISARTTRQRRRQLSRRIRTPTHRRGGPPGPVGNSVEQVAGTRTATAPSSSSTAVVIQERKTMIDRQLRIANNSCSCSSSSRNGGGAGAALNSEASNHHSQDNNSNSARGKERTTVPL